MIAVLTPISSVDFAAAAWCLSNALVGRRATAAGVFEETCFLFEHGFPMGPQSQPTEQSKVLSRQGQPFVFPD